MYTKNTKEEFIKKLKITNDRLEVIGEYNGYREDIKLRHKDCNHVFNMKPYNALRQKNCPICYKENQLQNKQKRVVQKKQTQDKIIATKNYYKENFLKKLKEKFPKIVPLEEYITTETKIRFKCLECGHEWYTTPHNFIDSRTQYGCPKCANRIKGLNKIVSKEEIENRLKNNGLDIQIVGEYFGRKHNTNCHCNKCDFDFVVTSESLNKQGFDCPNCRIINHKLCQTQEEAVEKFSKYRPDLTLIEEYKGNHQKIKVKSKKCGHEWENAAVNLLCGAGCPICLDRTFTHEEFIQKLKRKNCDVIPIGKYIGSKIKIEFECKKCKNHWYATPNMILRGNGCPKCSQSKMEKAVFNYLQTKKIEFETQKIFSDCKDKLPLRFDFYLPTYNVCIETDGIQHFQPTKFNQKLSDSVAEENFKDVKKKDDIKNNYCHKNKIKLIRIPYWDNNNISKILDDKLEIYIKEAV